MGEQEKVVKPYDRRSLTSAENGRRAWGLNLEAQVAELEEKIRALADTTDDGRLRFEVLRYLIDRRAGKPFVAVNPADRKAARTDNHIQIAAQTLILGPPSAPPSWRLHLVRLGCRNRRSAKAADQRSDQIAARTPAISGSSKQFRRVCDLAWLLKNYFCGVSTQIRVRKLLNVRSR